MRVSIILSLTLFSFNILAQLPNYFDNNPQWRQEFVFGGFYPCIEYDNYVYYLNGDSTIGNLTYKKVFKRGEVKREWFAPPPPVWCEEGPFLYDYFQTLMRQDSLRIYLYESGVEFLLYDFDLAIGDTLPTTYNVWMDDIVVTGVDSILVGDSYRKVFTHSEVGPAANVLIEGIGLGGGLLEDFPSIEFPSILLCFALNDTTYWPEYGFSCDLAVNLPSLNIKEKVCSFPNPVIDKLILELGNQIVIDNIVLLNSGNQEIRVEYKHLDQSKILMDLSKISPGLYILRLFIRNSSPLSLKVIKI